MLKVQLPEKLTFLANRMARYKSARGGRGSGKSWSFARAILGLGAIKPLRILCVREVQRSIKDSVHQLLKDQIDLLDAGSFYQTLETEIRGANGTKIIYSGLSALTVDQLKSFEAIDIVWAEEAQVISKRSWDILIPTIRKDDSEIWLSWNPDLETDDTYKRFVTNPPTDTISVEMNWRDNPWFNEVLNKERVRCKLYDPDNYDNIWEGQCRPAVEGAIYFKEIQRAEAEERIRNIPYDPLLKVHVVMDLGWEDSLAAGLVQKVLSEIRVIEYLEASHTSLDILSAELKTRPYNWGRVWLPHDGFNATLNAGGKSSYLIMKKLGWNCVPREEIVELSVEEGIRQARLIFNQVYFNKSKTHAAEAPMAGTVKGFEPTDLHWRLIEALKRYRRRVSPKTQAVSTPMKDQYAHAADFFRYMAIHADRMLNADERPRQDFSMASYEPLDAQIGM